MILIYRFKFAGFTLIELILAIVILSIGVTAFIRLINQTTAGSIDPVIIEQANAIAQSYLEEALLNPFCDPDISTSCPTFCSVDNMCSVCSSFEGLANRNLFDDVCDYGNINDNGAVDQAGNSITGLEDFNVSVNVVDTGVTLQGSPSGNTLDSTNGEVVRVDVTVTHDTFQSLNLTLSGYKANY